MKKLLSLFLMAPLSLAACAATPEDDIIADERPDLPELEVEEGFTTEYGDWNVYGFNEYENLNDGDLVTMQLRLDEATPGSAWGYETRWTDMFGLESKEKAKDLFGSYINRLVFSFPTEVMEDLTVGGVYFIELQKNVFPPNGRPQFGLEGIGPWGDGTDTDGKICSVNEMEECTDLTNNAYGEYSSLTNLREGGKHTIQTNWIVDPSGSGDYWGLGNEENDEYAYTDDFGTFDVNSLKDGQFYEFEISDTQWYADAHGQGDFYGYINIESAIEMEDPNAPEEPATPDLPEVPDYTFTNTAFNAMEQGQTYDHTLVYMTEAKSGFKMLFHDVNGMDITDLLSYHEYSCSVLSHTMVTGKWYVLNDFFTQYSDYYTFGSYQEITA